MKLWQPDDGPITMEQLTALRVLANAAREEFLKHRHHGPKYPLYQIALKRKADAERLAEQGVLQWIRQLPPAG